MRKLMKAEFYKLQKLPPVRMIFLFALAVGLFRGFSLYPGYQVYIAGLLPELFDAVLVSAFTVVFVYTEFSNRTFANAFLCGASRQKVFFAKLAVYFAGLLVLILLPLFASTFIATIRNGFGVDWDDAAMQMAIKFLFYIIYRFSMASFAVLVVSVFRDPLGSLGLSMAGMYLASSLQNSSETLPASIVWGVFLIKITVFLLAVIFIFVRRDLK